LASENLYQEIIAGFPLTLFFGGFSIWVYDYAKNSVLIISDKEISCYSSGTLTDLSTNWENINFIRVSKNNLAILLRSPGKSTKKLSSFLIKHSIMNNQAINLYDFLPYWQKGDLRSSIDRYLYTIIWDYEVKVERKSEFENIYSPNGQWAELFIKSEGYLGTEFLHDKSRSQRYLTIDRWRSKEAYELFLLQNENDYKALDATCANMTESENMIEESELIKQRNLIVR